MSDDDDNVQIGALDPIRIFTNQVADLIQITEAFKNHENLRAMDYLRAAHTVRENLNALIHVTVSAIMQDALHMHDRLTSEDLRAHTAEMEADMTSAEERLHKNILRLLENYSVSLSDLPPGLFPPGKEGDD